MGLFVSTNNGTKEIAQHWLQDGLDRGARFLVIWASKYEQSFWPGYTDDLTSLPNKSQSYVWGTVDLADASVTRQLQPTKKVA